MTSIVDICNQAIGHVGGKSKVQTVFPAPEATEAGRNCYLYFHAARRATLEAFDWRFASREQSLALYGTAPSRYTYQYAWPSDCLLPREIVQTTRAHDPVPFETGLSDDGTTKLILCDVEDAVLRYTRDLDNMTLWPEVANDALGWRLGMYLAIPLTRNAEMQKACENGFKFSLGQAHAVSANTRRKDPPRSSSWHRARN